MSTALARRTDPETSRQAAIDLGDTTPIEQRVLDCLRHNGRCTAHDVARLLNLELVTVSPRMAPLERAGKVERAGCRGRRTLWRIVQ